MKFRNPLFFAASLPMAMDGVLTLVGQGSSYWANFHQANEMSPAYYVMAIHPLFFVLGGAIWFLVVYFLFKKLQAPWDFIIAVAFISGHSWGSASWLSKLLAESGLFNISNRASLIEMWFVMIGYFVVIGAWSGFWISRKKT